ncbi:hypothetical protein [Phormidium nigroviride]
MAIAPSLGSVHSRRSAKVNLCHDLRTQPKKPGFFTQILRPHPQMLSKTRLLRRPA